MTQGDAPTGAVQLDASVPRADVAGWANTRRIMHVRHEGDDAVLPAFVTTAGWARLLERYCTGEGPVDGPGGRLSPTRVMLGLDRAIGRLMDAAAGEDARAGRALRAGYAVHSDLFDPAGGEVLLRLVVDRDTGVACVIAGMPEDLAPLDLAPLA
ncbi:hypothetical protein K6L44_12660 [Gluconacetobacter entanii]|uniref:hypothetical protein n=1 Tax=Gluconacetobacter entanii TaxID=108528 RepID=UPI001C9337B0|nr:hypothetical protein [Gluconacetobacter entanii]MBY4640817.1 hypothetical protein [Gluconacetobacter entanii]MCW4581513.1 hypothetical protein [Gluconacetobacter entanii]MCW4584893.1 hypothetical protein [Gluconacetobacter entanii]MCW4588306.1 hypothetical protein [Gluconacetobacter entanii]